MICVTGLDEAWPPGLFLGYYHDGARTVDVIKASGYRIGPLEVESALIEHPAVVEFRRRAAQDRQRQDQARPDPS